MLSKTKRSHSWDKGFELRNSGGDLGAVEEDLSDRGYPNYPRRGWPVGVSFRSTAPMATPAPVPAQASLAEGHSRLPCVLLRFRE